MMTAASAAAVEAAQKELGCERRVDSHGDVWCISGEHSSHRLIRWDECGCSEAVWVADAVVEALGMRVEKAIEARPAALIADWPKVSRVVSEWREVEP